MWTMVESEDIDDRPIKAAESLELYAILKPKEKNKGHGKHGWKWSRASCVVVIILAINSKSSPRSWPKVRQKS